MLDQHVSAFLDVKSSVKALSVLILSAEQPAELLPVLTPPGAHTFSPLRRGVPPRARSARKKNSIEFTPFSELGKHHIIIK